MILPEVEPNQQSKHYKGCRTKGIGSRVGGGDGGQGGRGGVKMETTVLEQQLKKKKKSNIDLGW